MKQKRATIQPLIHHQSTLQSNLNLIMITEELSPSPLDFSYYPWAYWILILIMYNYTIALDHYLLCICHYKAKSSFSSDLMLLVILQIKLTTTFHCGAKNCFYCWTLTTSLYTFTVLLWNQAFCDWVLCIFAVWICL